MTDNSSTPPNVASHPGSSVSASSLLPDPDDDFPDLNQPAASSNDPTAFVKPGADNKEGMKKGESYMTDYVPQYILGTLVVRVVAARDLEPVQKSGIGQMMLGGIRTVSGNARAAKGTANPYASVKFGDSTQRSSEVYDTLDPIWPRQEAMFMDVALPTDDVTHPEPSESSGTLETAASSPSESSKSFEYKKPPTLLTVALFHTPEVGQVNKFPSKGVNSGDSNDMFLGMASTDLQRLLTGKDHTFDGWLPLQGTETSCGSVRIVCEYEASDVPPQQGDYCRFTKYCSPRDLYPLHCGKQFQIAEVDGDNVLISYTTPEGWVCSFQAHRFMLLCEERHHSTVEVAQDELASLAERLGHSPLVNSLTSTVERVAVDGILNVGEEVVHGGLSLFHRWLSGGVDTFLGDVADVTNWDGRHNPDVGEGLDLPQMSSSDLDLPDDELDSKPAASINHIKLALVTQEETEALPNMPCCPITGEPMVDPVVAADGHTYERSAIARWLTTSNKSPMTGSILTHKELVPNYGLMSSVQEATTRASRAAAQSDIPLKVDVDVDESASLAHSLETMETITVSTPTMFEQSPSPPTTTAFLPHASSDNSENNLEFSPPN